MSIPGSGSPLLLATTAAAAAAEYVIPKSLRFNSDDTSYLNRTPSAAGNRRTWTLSWWMKLANPKDTDPQLFSIYTDANNRSGIFLDTSANYQLGFYSRVGGTTQLVVITDAVLRDYSAWYHCVISVDTTEATSSDRAKIYINGVEQSLSSSTYPSQNYETYWNLAAQHDIGRYGGATQLFDGLMADIQFVDGQALAPTDFGETRSSDGVWVPKEFTGSFSSYDQSETWSNGSVTTGSLNTGGGSSIAGCFDGSPAANTGIFTNSGAKIVYTFPSTINYTSKVELFAFRGEGNPGNSYFDLGDVTPSTNYHSQLASPGWITVATGSGSFDAITNQDQQDNGGWAGIKVDGILLVDPSVSVTVNSFHLKFADNSSNAALGTDSSGNSNTWTVNNLTSFNGTIANADGALPILNTSGDFGDTVESGTRTDSNSSNIVLALPMNGTNGGTTFTDQHATIKGSGSAKSVSAAGDAQTSTAQSFFYGSSAKFDGNDAITITDHSDFDFGSNNICIEFWFHLTTVANDKTFVGNYSGNNACQVFVGGSGGNKAGLQLRQSGGTYKDVYTSTSIDANRWYHLACVREGSDIKVYLDGSLENTTSFGSGSAIDANADMTVGNRTGTTANGITGYISDLRIYNGTAKYTSNFNVPSRTESGCDSLIDTPTNYEASSGNNGGNYATLNVLTQSSQGTIENGNLEFRSTSSQWGGSSSTIGMQSGKFYMEVNGGSKVMVGITSDPNAPSDGGYHSRSDSYTFYSFNGNKVNTDAQTSYSSAWTSSSDVVGAVYDADNGTLSFYRNGVSQGNAFTSLDTSKTWHFVAYTKDSTAVPCNFGQRPFAYTPPTGYKSLCTTNLPDPTIADGSTAMDAKLYTGNGSTQSITGYGFSPDWVWIKRRNSSGDHQLYDIVRGANKGLSSDQNIAEWTYSGGLSSFDSDGFSIGSLGGANASGDSHVAWAWDGGTSTVSNTDGSITSSVRANASAGFSIVGYTGDGNAATIGHGLNAAPELIIKKFRSATSSWDVYHASAGSGKRLVLNATDAVVTTSSYANVNSSTFDVHAGNNDSGVTMIAYCFAPVAGYSAIGSYEGNGASGYPNADGPFVYTGMRPAFVMIKSADASESWVIYDTARDTFNVLDNQLYPNSSNAEASGANREIDVYSNGFKIRSNGGFVNTSGDTYIYLAFAEHPLKTARAR